MAANGNRRPPAESRWDSDGSVSPHPPDLPDPVLSVTHILSPQRFLRLHFTCVVLMALVRGPFGVCDHPTAPRLSAFLWCNVSVQQLWATFTASRFPVEEGQISQGGYDT